MNQTVAAVATDPVQMEPDRTLQQTIGYYGAFFALGLLTAALGPSLPELAQQTGTQLYEISYLSLMRSLGFVIGGVLFGKIYDRVKGHPLLAGGVLALALLVAVTPHVPLLALLLPIFLLQGLAGSTMSVGGNTLLVWAHRGKTGSLLGGLHFCWGFGAFLAPIITARAMKLSGGIALPYLILAVLTLPVCVWLLRLPSPTHQHHEHSETFEESKPLFVALLCAFFFLYTGTESCFGNWIFTYAIKTRPEISTTAAAYLNSAFWGLLTVGRLAAIPLATRIRPRTILTTDLAGCLLSVLAMLLWPRSTTALWAGICGLGLSLASIFPTGVAFAGRRMKLSGSVTGLFFGCASAGAMVMPWLIGQFFETVGPQVLLYVSMTTLLTEIVIFAVLMLYPRRTARVVPAAEEAEEVDEVDVVV